MASSSSSHHTGMRRILASCAVLLLLLTGAVALTAASPAGATAPPAVTSSGTGLLLNGQPWWPAGVDAYELGTDWTVNAGCGAMVDLDSFFAGLPPHSLVRFDAFQALAINKNTGALDYSALDNVFSAAAAYHQYVLPVLAPQDGSCDNGIYKQESWYQSGWNQVLGPISENVTSFHTWVRNAVTRWKDSPALAGWELVGEPEDPICNDPTCNWQTNTCPSNAAQVLRGFMDTAGALVRSIDPAHLIFGGFTGGGQCGTAYTDYQYVAASPGIDVLEYHDYGADGVPLPGDQWNGLAFRLQQAAAVNKPLLVAEVGEDAGSCESLQTRSDDIQTKIEGQRAAGTAGVLAWDWVPDPRTDECTYDIGPGDPALAMLAAHNTLG
jgi:mannan endo-1,4-beta-mannosidase